MSLQTFIIQGEVAEDPDDEDITVGVLFWSLPEVLYFDRHICFVRKVPEGFLVNPFGECKKYQNWRGQEKKLDFFSLG